MKRNLLIFFLLYVLDIAGRSRQTVPSSHTYVVDNSRNETARRKVFLPIRREQLKTFGNVRGVCACDRYHVHTYVCAPRRCSERFALRFQREPDCRPDCRGFVRKIRSSFRSNRLRDITSNVVARVRRPNERRFTPLTETKGNNKRYVGRARSVNIDVPRALTFNQI